MFAATEAGVTALWGNPHFGLSPRRLYQVSVRPDVRGTLRDLDDDADIRVIAAQTTQALQRDGRRSRARPAS